MSTHMHKSKLYIHNMHYIQKHVNHCMKIIIIYHNVSISTSLMFSSHTISHNEYYSIYKGILDAPWCPCNRQVKRGVSLVGCISDITWLVFLYELLTWHVAAIVIIARFLTSACSLSFPALAWFWCQNRCFRASSFLRNFGPFLFSAW